YQPGKHAEYSALRTARDESRRWRFAEEAAVAGTGFGGEYGHLALEAEDAPVHVGDSAQHARVVHQIARGEVVGAVDDHIVAAKNLERVLRSQSGVVRLHVHMRVHVGDPVASGVELRPAEILRSMDYLTVQVGQVNQV